MQKTLTFTSQIWIDFKSCFEQNSKYLTKLDYTKLYWALQGYTGLFRALLAWLYWAILWYKGFSRLYWVIKGYTASATTAVAIRAKVWHSDSVSHWVSESVTVLDLERLAPLKILGQIVLGVVSFALWGRLQNFRPLGPFFLVKLKFQWRFHSIYGRFHSIYGGEKQ